MVEDQKAIHLILGLSAAASIRNAFGLSRNQTIVCLDIPSLGRQRTIDDFSSWEKERSGELRSLFGDEMVDSIAADFGASTFTNPALFESNEPLVIWSDELLSTQLMIAFVCQAFKNLGLDHSRIHILTYGSNDPKSGRLALGLLTEKMLKKRRPDIEKVTKNDIELYVEIWNHYCSNQPSDHAELIRHSAFLARTRNATASLLRRYPKMSTGLDTMQTELLHFSFKNAPKTHRIVGESMEHNDTADRVGDLHLYNLLLEMGDPALKSPVLKLEFSNDSFSMANCSTKVLLLAHEVYEGRKSYIDLNGIDRWIGGVHQSADNLIYQEDLVA